MKWRSKKTNTSDQAVLEQIVNQHRRKKSSFPKAQNKNKKGKSDQIVRKNSRINYLEKTK